MKTKFNALMVLMVSLLCLMSVIVLCPSIPAPEGGGDDDDDDDGGGGDYGDTNFRPIATIDMISPNPAEEFETVTFSGHGNDSDGDIVNYWWEVDGILMSNNASFSLNNLTSGIHEILFWAMDDKEKWSNPVISSLEVIQNLPPETPSITGEAQSSVKEPYHINVTSVDPNGKQVLCMVDWGDGTPMNWDGPYNSGQEISFKHSYEERGEYAIQVKAKDIYGLESDWATLTVTMPCSYDRSIPQFLELLFQRFPYAFPLLRQLMG